MTNVEVSAETTKTLVVAAVALPSSVGPPLPLQIKQELTASEKSFSGKEFSAFT